MNFLMGSFGWLIAGLAVASIPIIIHLLHRQRTTPLQWGAMQFLLESPLQRKRRKRVDHWILMLLRVLALAVLALLLARPLWIKGKYNPLAGRLNADVAVVIDHSLSTGRKAGGKTLFDESRGIVDKIAESLRPADTLSVVLAEHRPLAFTPLPVGGNDTQAVRTALSKLTPGETDCSIPEAVQAARELAARGRNIHKIVIVVSDGQKTSWQADNDSAWKLAVGSTTKAADRNVAIHSLPLSTNSDASNISIGAIAVQPSLVGVNRPVQFTASVANSGPKDVAGINVRLTVNGKATDQSRLIASLPANQTETVRFDYTFTTPGSNWVKVETDVVDALAADNASVAAVQAWPKLPVLIIDGQLTSGSGFRSSDFLVSALQPVERSEEPGTLVQPRVMSLSDGAAANLDDYFVVIVNDCASLPTTLQTRLLNYAKSGHGVWFILGRRMDPAFLSIQLGRAGLFAATLNSTEPRKDTAPPALEVKDPKNPMVALLTDAQRNAMSGAVTNRWWSLSPQDPDDRVVLAATSGDPLIIERPMGRNGGRIAVWCTGVDGEWNNWPLMSNFVPLVNETIYHLSTGQTRGLDNRGLDAGEPIVWTAPIKPAVTAVDVIRPDNTIDGNKRPTLANGRYEFRYNDAFAPGLYQLRFTPTEIRPQPVFYGVGIDRRELDPTPLSAAERDKLATDGYLDRYNGKSEIAIDDLSAVIRKENRGTDLWKWLALIVLASLVAETYMTHRMISAQKKVDVLGVMRNKPMSV